MLKMLKLLHPEVAGFRDGKATYRWEKSYL